MKALLSKKVAWAKNTSTKAFPRYGAITFSITARSKTFSFSTVLYSMVAYGECAFFKSYKSGKNPFEIEGSYYLNKKKCILKGTVA